MNAPHAPNDLSAVIEADRNHLWHHLIQHKPFESVDPRVIVEGKGVRVWDALGKEHLDAVSGGVWTVNVGYGRERIANAVRDQLIQMPYFAGSAGSIPGARFAETSAMADGNTRFCFESAITTARRLPVCLLAVSQSGMRSMDLIPPVSSRFRTALSTEHRSRPKTMANGLPTRLKK